LSHGYEKNIDQSSYYHHFRVLFLFLRFDMDITSLMLPSGRKIILLIFWMGVAGATVIVIDSMFQIPDELSGVMYFLSIGIAASSVLNKYR